MYSVNTTAGCSGGTCTITPEYSLSPGAFYEWQVRGYNDAGTGPWSAIGAYEIQYADGSTQVVPLVTGLTCDDWTSPPAASSVVCGLRGKPWHLNVLGVELRPVEMKKIIFRDYGTPAAPLLAAVTVER